MKKFLLAMCLVLGLTAAVVAYAAPDIGLNGKNSASDIAGRAGYNTKGVNGTTLSETVGRIVRVVLGLVGTIFLVLTIYAGILWMTAQGNEEQVGKATSIIKTAIVGLIITLAAYGITSFVLYYTEISTGQYGAQAVGAQLPQQAQQQQGGFWSNWTNSWKTSASSMWTGIKNAVVGK